MSDPQSSKSFTPAATFKGGNTTTRHRTGDRVGSPPRRSGRHLDVYGVALRRRQKMIDQIDVEHLLTAAFSECGQEFLSVYV